MIEQDCTDRAIGLHIVFAGRVIPMPCHDIEGRLPDFGLVELSAPFDDNTAWHFAILKGRHRRFKVSRVGQTVRPDGAAIRQGKSLPVVLADKTTRRTLQHLDPVNQPAGQNRDLLRFNIHHAQFGGKPQPSLLRHH